VQSEDVGEGQFVRLGRVEPGGGEHRVHALGNRIPPAHEVEALRLERLDVLALERVHDEVLTGKSNGTHGVFLLN
jgi:hypothetical protein